MPQIENGLIAAGQEAIVCMTEPHARLRGPAEQLPYRVVTINHWDAWSEIAAVAASLRGQIEHVATRWEGAIVPAAFVRDLLDLPGQTMHEAVGYVDKAVMKSRLHQGGVPVAQHRIVRHVPDVAAAADELGWPIVVKPLRGFASTNTHVIRSPDELADAQTAGRFEIPLDASPYYAGDPAFVGLARQGRILVEEYVDIVHEYHCDGLWIDGEPVYQLPGLYHTPPLRGMGGMLGSVLLPTGSHDSRIVSDLATRAAKTLGIMTGFTHAEVLRTAGGRWLLGEIAYRPGGGGIQQAIGHAYGVDVPAIQAQVACGQTPDVQLTTRAPHPVVGWTGPAVPAGIVTAIADRQALLGHPGVIDATVAVKVGQQGGRTGSGLWGGLAGYTYLEGDSVGQVLGMMHDAAERYRVRVDEPQLAGAR
ncbi:MAG: ATP-grasp domain-containing protein [Thermoactinospora sp.]|nr:ATP-grasp domain-containing protein [Thermoactinospora sp.]